MEDLNIGGKFVRRFANLAEIVAHIHETPRVWPSDTSRSQSASTSWDDNAGYEGALRLARDGWPEGIKQMHAMAQLVPTSYVTTRGYDVAGDYPDVGRALGGDPRNMVRRGKVSRPRPVVTIAVNIGISGGFEGKILMTYGAALTGLIDRLESRGCRVELVAGIPSLAGGGETFGTTWTVKRAEDVLDLSAIAFSIAHPAMFRRLIFAVWERCPRRLYESGYGSPTAVKPWIFGEIPEDALILNGPQDAPGECRTLEGASKWLEVQINTKFGTKVAELEVV